MHPAAMRSAIARKRDGGQLSAAEWSAVIGGYMRGTVDEAQMAALAMACAIQGLDLDETRGLTVALIESGERLAFDAGLGTVVDKHSTGGVGDTTSLIVVPLVAACGVPVAKLSGRALAHTGGTLEKLEAVRGVRTDLDPERFAAQVRSVGCAIAAQSERFVPADKRLYALRDRTATVPEIGLIAASIVSKKIAGGAQLIAYDVKVGRGAFMPDLARARVLANRLVAVTRTFGRTAFAVVSDMEEPLGPAIGTGLEVDEALAFLAGRRRDHRLAELCRTIAVALVAAAKPDVDAEETVARALNSGAAAERFATMLRAQGATGEMPEPPPRRHAATVRADVDGVLAAIDPVALGEIARACVARFGPLGGIVVRARVGDRTAAGEPLATVFGGVPEDLERVRVAFGIAESAPPPRPVVYEIVDATPESGGDAASGSPVRSTDASR
jgi:pyrimidine-nucleoside phosphorylase